jgi:hypothetical protein
MAIHVFGVTNDDNLWHSIVPDQDDFGDVDGAGGTGRPWRKGTTPPTAQDSACAADSEGNLHVLVVSDDGRLWHTRRDARDRTWSSFGNVEAGGAGNIGTVTAVAAATEGTALHILAVNSNKELHRTVWNPRLRPARLASTPDSRRSAPGTRPRANSTRSPRPGFRPSLRPARPGSSSTTSPSCARPAAPPPTSG